MITRQQIRRAGRQMILQSISSDIVLPRSIRREMARQLEKKDWAKRDKLAVERLKIRVSAANIH